MTTPLSAHPAVLAWIEEIRALCQPETVHWCDGSDDENQALCDQMVQSGTFIPLNAEKRPGCYLARSAPSDVARVEDRTFICTRRRGQAGPTNHWKAPLEMKALLREKFHGAMRGRTLYVVPFCMGPLDSPLALVGVQVTDSPYAVVNMRIMARMGAKVWEKLGSDGRWVPCLHSVGAPLQASEADVPWPCNEE